MPRSFSPAALFRATARRVAASLRASLSRLFFALLAASLAVGSLDASVAAGETPLPAAPARSGPERPAFDDYSEAYPIHWRVVWSAAIVGFLLAAFASFLSVNVLRRLKAERELEAARNLLRGVIDFMPSILASVDGQGRITQWNREAERLTGLTAEAAWGRPAPDVLPLFRSQLVRLAEALERRGLVREEKVCFRTDEGARCFDLMIYPLPGDADAEGGAVIRVDDVTARTRMEEMMVQTEKMISVAGLAAGMAHEINNPLGGAAQGAQNVMRRLSPDLKSNRDVAAELGLDLDLLRQYQERRGVADMLRSIQDSIDRASRIVSGMLSFSRNAATPKRPANLPALLDQALELARSDYALKKRHDFRHIRITRDYDQDLPPVPCSETEITQVALNIIKNCAQAMARAGTPEPALSLRIRREADHAVMVIEDNGPGMDEETRRRAFEPFYTTKELGDGVGLGLSVSYFIVSESHGGELRVESEPGDGAAFHVRLPLRGASGGES